MLTDELSYHLSLIIISIKHIYNFFFKMENTTSITWLDLLTTEILFLIFEYLSTNDIL